MVLFKNLFFEAWNDKIHRQNVGETQYELFYIDLKIWHGSEIDRIIFHESTAALSEKIEKELFKILNRMKMVAKLNSRAWSIENRFLQTRCRRFRKIYWWLASLSAEWEVTNRKRKQKWKRIYDKRFWIISASSIEKVILCGFA